jgi:hypothetical protein
VNTIWNVVAWASIALVTLSAWSMVRSLGRDRPLRSRGLTLTLVLSLVTLVVYERLIPGPPDSWAWGLAVGGLVCGALVSLTTRLSVAGREIVGRPSPWIAVQWVGLFAVAQLAALGVLFGSAGAGVAALFLATGVAVGGTATLLRRRQLLATHIGTSSVTCPHCHALLALGNERCAQCSWHVRTRARRAPWAPPQAEG